MAKSFHIAKGRRAHLYIGIISNNFTSMPLDLSIVVINYNTIRLTKNCIQSIIRHTKGLTYEIILVDNNSSEEGIDLLQSDYENIKIIRSNENLGFAGGNNLGIKSASGKYILLLNSDTYLVDNALHTAVRYMEGHPKIGVMSVRLVYPDGRHQSVAQRFPSVKYSLIELFRIQKLVGRKAAGRMLLGAFFNHDENVKADWVWGAFFLFPAAILDKLPSRKLDDTYFMYFEDAQWCLDIGRLGYEVHFCAKAEIVHLMGGSSGKKNEMMEKNEKLFLNRNYKPWQVWCIKKVDQWLKN